MKIFQISNRVPWPLNEGGTIGIYNYTRAYAELGNDVTIYCLDGIKHNTPIKEANEELSKYSKVLIHPIDTDVKPDEAFKHLLKGESYNVSRFYNSDFEKLIAEELQSANYDVVQLEGTFAGPYIDIVRKHHKGLLSLRMHNVEYEIWERLAGIERNPLKKWYLGKLAKQLKRYETEIIKKVDTIVPVTQNDIDKFRLLHPSGEYLNIPAGIDLRTWEFMPSYQTDNWYHIGSMEWHGNVDAVKWYLDHVHRQIIAESEEYTLHLAGKGIDTNDYGGISKVKVYSDVPDAFKFVKELDVCLVPLRSGSGIRLKILEAMAAGKLVISTTIGAQGIDAADGIHLLIADEPGDYVSIFSKLRQGEYNVQKIVNNARKLIEESYSTEALASKQLSYYTSLME